MTAQNHNLRPMLSATLTSNEALQGQLPVYASPKLDGIRCRILEGIPLSRSGKLVRNLHVQTWAMEFRKWLNHLDGELIVDEPNTPGVYNRTSRGIMSEGGTPDFRFYVFDHTEFEDKSFSYRLGLAESTILALNAADWPERHRTHLLVQEWIHTVEDLQRYEARIIQEGYEGVILRHPLQPYKHGRSTIKQFGMVKVKRFVDAEALIIDFEELLHNANPAQVNELGYTSHTSHKEHQVPMDTLGALICQTNTELPPDLPVGTQFKIGTGFDHQTRQEIWDNRKKYVGQTVKFKYLPIGSIDKPRHPVFLGLRDKEDM